MNNKETALELLLKADGLISQAKELLAQAVDDESESTNCANDTLAAWREHIVTKAAYGLRDDDEVESITDEGYPLYIDDFNPYGTYPTEEYALMAQKMKIFNDKLLAFKWCYDRDFQPDWSDERYKYYIAFNSHTQGYEVGYTLVAEQPTVYFRTQRVALDCAMWLNSLEETES